MNLLLKSGAIVFLGGGGATVIPFINFSSFTNTNRVVSAISNSVGEDHSQQSNPASSSTVPELSSRITFPLEVIKIEEKNCKLKTEKDEVTSKLSDFVTFSCDNSGKDDSEINAMWTVWLPVSFLQEQGEGWFIEGQKIEIKTSTSHIENNSDYSSSDYLLDTEFYRTIFESESFVNKKIIGEWGKHYFEDSLEVAEDDSYVWKVKIIDPTTDQQFIYLKR